jgi:excisionase family DNA binding protein
LKASSQRGPVLFLFPEEVTHVNSHATFNPAYSSRKAAEYIDVHYRHLLELADEGKIKAHRTAGGRLKFRLSDLNEYLDTLPIKKGNPV